MKKFGRLYIDIDDTIFGRYHRDSFLELRPGVIGQLRVLAKLFDCYWLTCWPWENPPSNMDVHTLLRILYAQDLTKDMKYMRWKGADPDGKAGAVLDPTQPQDFWWLEDKLGREELAALERAGKLDRYIEVDSVGPWKFADACLELFKRAGIDHENLMKAGGRIKFFRKEDFLTPVIIPA